jgi:hypothetical protein
MENSEQESESVTIPSLTQLVLRGVTRREFLVGGLANRNEQGSQRLWW